MLKNAQTKHLTECLVGKTIHGKFQEKDYDSQGSHLWLSMSKLSSESEGLIFAMQDGVILARAYQSHVMKEPGDR